MMKYLGWTTPVIIAGAVVWFLQSGIPYQTGQQWFYSCWASQHSRHPPINSNEAKAWARCTYVAKKALFDAGFVFSGNPKYAVTPSLKAIHNACPSNYSDIPIGGVDILAVSLIQQTAGDTFIDRFIPPDSMIVRAFKSKWPNCPSVRLTAGFPKIVEKNGEWVYETRCVPCEAEKKAMGTQ
jgi:hypothetical protein